MTIVGADGWTIVGAKKAAALKGAATKRRAQHAVPLQAAELVLSFAIHESRNTSHKSRNKD